MREYALKEKKNRLLRDKAELEEQLRKIREKELKEKRSLEKGTQKSKRQVGWLTAYASNYFILKGCVDTKLLSL